MLAYVIGVNSGKLHIIDYNIGLIYNITTLPSCLFSCKFGGYGDKAEKTLNLVHYSL